jgi:hypothetical protein
VQSVPPRWDADLADLITVGRGDVPLVRLRWRCGNCDSRLMEFRADLPHEAGQRLVIILSAIIHLRSQV